MDTDETRKNKGIGLGSERIFEARPSDAKLSKQIRVSSVLIRG